MPKMGAGTLDKYEYKVRADEINRLIAEGDYAQAAEIADGIDWRRVKSVMMLCTVSDLYKINRRYDDAKNMLLLAYERRPGGRTICYALCELCVKTEDFVQAVNFYKEFVQAAPKDPGRYILQYKIYEAQDVSLEERIGVLEELKKRDYREKWAYELAYLYHRVGLGTRCVEECDELILWFGEGKYVVKAMELKMLHQPLTPAQQEAYDHRFDRYDRPSAAEETSSEPEGQEEALDQEWQEENGGVPQEQEELYGQQEDWNAGHGQEGAAGEAGAAAEEGLDIQVKTMDVGKFNTINLQEELAAGLQEVLGADETARSPIGPMSEPGAESEDMEGRESLPASDEETFLQEPEDEDEVEVFFGETGELKGVPSDMAQEISPGGPAGSTVYEERAAVEAERPEEESSPAEGIEGPAAQAERPAEGSSPAAQAKRLVAGAEHLAATNASAADQIGSQVMEQMREETLAAQISEENGEESLSAQPPRELAGVLSQESDGQIRLVMPESAAVEKQITGQMKIEDILAEWERMKKENQEKRREEVRQHVLQQTGPMFTEFEAAVRDGLLEQLETEPEETEQESFEDIMRFADDGTESEGANEIEELAVLEAEEAIGRSEAGAEEGDVAEEADDTDAYFGEDAETADYLGETADSEEPEESGVSEGLSEEDLEEEDYSEEAENSEEPEEYGYVEEFDESEESEGFEEFDESEESEGPEEFDESEASEELEEFDESEESDGLDGVEGFDDLEEPEGFGDTEEDAEDFDAEDFEDPELDEYADDTDDAEDMDTDADVDADMYTELDNDADEYIDEEISEDIDTEEDIDEEISKNIDTEEDIDTEKDIDTEEDIDTAEDIDTEEVVNADEAVGGDPESERKEASRSSDKAAGSDAQHKAEQKAGHKKSGQQSPGHKKDDQQKPGRQNSERPPVERDKAKVRALTREEKELFAPFVQSRRAREQLVKAIDNVSMAAYTGNIVITGEEGMDTLTLAKNMIREIKMADSNFAGKVAKISGRDLNDRNVRKTLEEMNSGALIIYKASGMDPDTARALYRSLQQERLGIVVVLEDTKKAIQKLFAANQELSGAFTARVDVEALSNDMLVLFGKRYAREMEYSIDELGVLALHTRIEELQTIDHVVTVVDVKRIVDEAIRHASRKTLGHFFDILLAKRYDDEDMVVLTEKDFVA